VTCSVSIENRYPRMFPEDVRELAAGVASALEALPRSLGATKMISGHRD
jgi:hypothetical protein